MTKTRGTGPTGWFSPTAFVGLLLLATLAMVFGALVLLEPDNSPPPEPPSMSFVLNETRDTVRVNETDPGLAWSQFQVKMDRPGMFNVHGDENHTTAEPMVFVRISNESQTLVGERLRFCMENGGGELEVTLRHTGTNRVIETFHFLDVASCVPEEPEDNETTENGTQDDGADDNVSEELPTDATNVTSRSAPRQEG